MSLIVKFTCVVILLSSPISELFADEEANSLTSMDIEKKYLLKRFKGFDKHLKAYRTYHNNRDENLNESKKRKVQFDEQQELIRKNYIKRKAKIKKEEVDIDALMLIEQEKRDKIRAKKRIAYKKEKALIKKLRETTQKIPDDIDVGLKTLYQMTLKSKLSNLPPKVPVE